MGNQMTLNVNDLLAQARDGEIELQPAVLMNHNLDPTQVAEITSYTVERASEEEIRELLARGWLIFRVQTEWTPLGGHRTKAYLAKLK
ncbi:hypothetical protein KW786_00750 [Candidatus Parcubacteria bacterium]|nr:hypothetical protein [Candidatus Parcubacteria bacterium]